MILSLRHPVDRRAGRPLPLMQARPGEPTLGLASRAFRQGCGRIGAAPAAQDTGLKTGVGWASPRTGRGPLGHLGPSPPICLPCSSRRIRNPPPSQACGSEPSGWTGWPHMCAVSPQPRESPPTPRRLAQWVLITHTEIPRTVCSPSSFPHEPWKLDFP